MSSEFPKMCKQDWQILRIYSINKRKKRQDVKKIDLNRNSTRMMSKCKQSQPIFLCDAFAWNECSFEISSKFNKTRQHLWRHSMSVSKMKGT